MTIKVVRLMHAGIRIAPDPETISQAEAVYADLLGLPLDGNRPEIPGIPGFWANIDGPDGPQQVHVMGAQGESPVARSQVQDPSRPHLAFTVEDIEAAKQELEQRGIEFWIFGGLVGPASEQVFFEDGCGNMIELQQEK